MDLETIFQGKPNAHKWKLLGDYLKGQKLHPGAGIIMQNSESSGVSISTLRAREIKQSQAPPFSILSVRPVADSDPQQYILTMQDGFVISRVTQSDVNAVEFHECKIGADFMSVRPRPPLAVVSGDYITVQYTTDEEGNVDSVPVVGVTADEDSDHHQPPSGEGVGAAGSYYTKLIKFEIVDGNPRIVVYQQSDIEHSRLWTGRNVGGARYIHKQWDGVADRYDFRTLKQVDIPALRAGGKVIVPETNDEFDDENDAIKFSCIVEKLEDPQVRVTDDGAGVITVRGNNKYGTLNQQDCYGSSVEILRWEDGLITTDAPGAGKIIVVPDCPT